MWQEGYGEDDLGLPIMHWEALSLRIAELEKQEEERKEKAKLMPQSVVPVERGRGLAGRMEERERGRRKESWEDEEDDCNSRLTALTSRQTNLQLCFINDSESDEEEELTKNKNSKMAAKRGTVQVPQQQQQPQPPATADKKKPTGVRAALRSLRNKLRSEQKKVSPVSKDCGVKRRRLEQSDLQSHSLKELTALRNSLSQEIQDLSSDLVGRLLTRDQLRTEQDAMLQEVQDLTSL